MTTTMERQVTEKDMIDSELVSWVDNLYKKSDRDASEILRKIASIALQPNILQDQ